MNIKEALLLFIFISIVIPSVFSISDVQHSMDENKVTITYEGNPPFLINIRPEKNIGGLGGYIWVKTYSNSVTYDMDFANNPSHRFYYAIKDSDMWSELHSFELIVACNNGERRLCPNQFGVCQGSHESCANSRWSGCDYSTIHGYEYDERSCDLSDNDCDGIVDEMISIDPNNCGGCGKVCDLDNVKTQNCTTSECTIVTCDSGWVDLNGVASDGCEYSCVPMGDEICDGTDNNCDNQIDEGFFGEDCLEKCRAEGGTDYNTARDSGLKCCGDNDLEDNPYEAAESSCSDGNDNDCDGLIDSDDSNCQINNRKNLFNYNRKELFLISDQNWKDILSLVPLVAWTGSEAQCQRGYGTPDDVCVYPTLIYHNEDSGFDADSIIHFMQQYSPDRVTIIGETPQELDNLLIAAPELGAGLSKGQIQRITSKDYLSYWEYYREVVYAEDDYETALFASTYASLINAPLIIEGYFYDDSSALGDKNVICVGDAGRDCDERYTLAELQQKYVDETQTDKIMLVNPNDLDLHINEEFQPEKSLNPILKTYGKTSLASPILASAKHEILISVNSKDYLEVDSALKNKISTLGLHPGYLTILASPVAIDMTKINPNVTDWINGPLMEEVDNHIYGKKNKGLFQDMAVGRIFSLTLSDVSSQVSRDLFYDKMPHTKKYTLIWPDIQNMKVELKALDKLLQQLQYENLSYYVDEKGYEKVVNGDSYYYASKINETQLMQSSEDNFLITYGDHAWTNGWSYFNINTLRSNRIWLDSPLIFSEGCGTCAFDKSYQKTDLFCSEVIRRGAVAFFGATTDASATNWDPNQMFYNELISNIDIGTASKNVRNRAITQAYPISASMNGGFLGPYDSWNILIGDPTFNPNFGLSYGSSENIIEIQGEVRGSNYFFKINIPENQRNIKIRLYHYYDGVTRYEGELYEHPLGPHINRFYGGSHSVYNDATGELLSQYCSENNEYTFKVNIPLNKKITSIENVIFQSGSDEIRLGYMPVYGPQFEESVNPWNTPKFNFIRYYRDIITGEYYIAFDESLSFTDWSHPEDSILFCDGTGLPAREYTITFKLEDITI